MNIEQYQPISFEEVDKMTITTNLILLKDLGFFAKKIKPITGLDINEILNIFGLKQGKYTTDQIKKSSEFQNLDETEKQKESQENRDLYSEINDYKKDVMDRLTGLPAKLFNVLLESGLDENNNPIGLLDDLLNILSKATGQTKHRLLNSDYVILSELFLRVIVKKQSKVNESFFTMKLFQMLKEVFPFLNYTRIEN